MDDYLVLTRKVADEADSLVLLFHANAIGALALTVIAPATARMPNILAEWMILPVLGLFGMAGHWCLIKAYAIAERLLGIPFHMSLTEQEMAVISDALAAAI